MVMCGKGKERAEEGEMDKSVWTNGLSGVSEALRRNVVPRRS